MAVKRPAARETSLENVAKLFQENGVLIIDYEAGKGGVQEIRFNGDENAGFTAVEVAKEIGLTPWKLRRVWHHIYGLENHPHWELTFLHQSLNLLPLDGDPEGAEQ